MTGTLLALGVSHKTAPLPVRERLALPEGRAASVLRELVGHADVHEAVAISTCNRTEVYLVVGDAVEAETTVLGMLAGSLAGLAFAAGRWLAGPPLLPWVGFAAVGAGPLA